MRRSFILILSLIVFTGCSHFQPKTDATAPAPAKDDSKAAPAFPSALSISKSKRFKPGRLVVIQGPTSATESLINVMVPRLKTYSYVVTSANGKTIPVEKYETIQFAPVFWKVDKLHLKGLESGVTYKLEIVDEFRNSKTVVDERSFQALNLAKDKIRFATLSCMADDWRFEEVIDGMWARLKGEKPEMIVLNGDVVYVDSFDFVERRKATEQDIWQRYIDSFNRIPLYHFERLIPILATWDDHDFGTNDADRDFAGKDSAKRIFRAFFGGRELPGVFEYGPGGTYAVFTGFKQRLYLMDGRFYRQPNKNQKTQEPFGHWGQQQHQWLIGHLTSHQMPSWIFNGDQIFSGKPLDYKESFEGNHPAHFKRLMEDLKKIKEPFVFASGDIHFSEIMKVPAGRNLDVETYEITSSAMHSYTGEGWDNPLRMPGMKTTEFNFMMVTSEAVSPTALKVDVRAVGLAPQDYFKTSFEIKKTP